jgi:hypothetical protein
VRGKGINFAILGSISAEIKMLKKSVPTAQKIKRFTKYLIPALE